MPSDPGSVVQVLWWVVLGLSAAVVAQWGYMIVSQRMAREERLEMFQRVGEAVSENTAALQELTIWLKSGGTR